MNELIKKYPKLFNDSHYDYGCGAGWHPLIADICRYISNKQKGFLPLKAPKSKYQTHDCSTLPLFNLKFEQIKEKFGTLRVYFSITQVEHDWNIFDKDKYEREFDRTHSDINGYINAMETISSRVCEGCGNPGKSRDGGWIKVLCDNCCKK